MLCNVDIQLIKICLACQKIIMGHLYCCNQLKLLPGYHFGNKFNMYFHVTRVSFIKLQLQSTRGLWWKELKSSSFSCSCSCLVRMFWLLAADTCVLLTLAECHFLGNNHENKMPLDFKKPQGTMRYRPQIIKHAQMLSYILITIKFT